MKQYKSIIYVSYKDKQNYFTNILTTYEEAKDVSKQ